MAFEYFDIARDFFMELEDMGSENGAAMAIQVKDYMDLIEDTQIPLSKATRFNQLNFNHK